MATTLVHWTHWALEAGAHAWTFWSLAQDDWARAAQALHAVEPAPSAYVVPLAQGEQAEAPVALA